MNDKADKILESGLTEALKAPGNERLAQVPRVEPSLPDQIAQLERIERTIEDKVRRERVAVITEHDERWTRLRSNYTRDLSDIQARLSRDLATAMRELESETAAKLHQLDQIEKRRG